MKILTNYIQIVSIIGAFEFNWPALVFYSINHIFFSVNKLF